MMNRHMGIAANLIDRDEQPVLPTPWVQVAAASKLGDGRVAMLAGLWLVAKLGVVLAESLLMQACLRSLLAERRPGYYRMMGHHEDAYGDSYASDGSSRALSYPGRLSAGRLLYVMLCTSSMPSRLTLDVNPNPNLNLRRTLGAHLCEALTPHPQPTPTPSPNFAFVS